MPLKRVVRFKGRTITGSPWERNLILVKSQIVIKIGEQKESFISLAVVRTYEAKLIVWVDFGGRTEGCF